MTEQFFDDKYLIRPYLHINDGPIIAQRLHESDRISLLEDVQNLAQSFQQNGDTQNKNITQLYNIFLMSPSSNELQLQIQNSCEPVAGNQYIFKIGSQRHDIISLINKHRPVLIRNYIKLKAGTENNINDYIHKLPQFQNLRDYLTLNSSLSDEDTMKDDLEFIKQYFKDLMDQQDVYFIRQVKRKDKSILRCLTENFKINLIQQNQLIQPVMKDSYMKSLIMNNNPLQYIKLEQLFYYIMSDIRIIQYLIKIPRCIPLLQRTILPHPIRPQSIHDVKSFIMKKFKIKQLLVLYQQVHSINDTEDQRFNLLHTRKKAYIRSDP